MPTDTTLVDVDALEREHDHGLALFDQDPTQAIAWLPKLYERWSCFLDWVDRSITTLPDLDRQPIEQCGTHSLDWLRSLREALARRRVDELRPLLGKPAAKLISGWRQTEFGSASREVWGITRHDYMEDYLRAFVKLGFEGRLITRHCAERWVLAGLRPVAVIDSNLAAKTIDIMAQHDVPFIGLPLDQWAHVSDHPVSRPDPPPSPCYAKLELPTLAPAIGDNFPVSASKTRRRRSYLFVVGDEQVPLFEERRVRHVEQLHFGVNCDRLSPLTGRHPLGAATSSDDIAFIGSSLRGNRLNGARILRAHFARAIGAAIEEREQQLWQRHRELLDAAVTTQAATFGDFVLPSRIAELEGEYGIDFLEPGMTSRKQTWINLIGYEAAMLHRLQVVVRLSPLGLAVYGDDGWCGANLPRLDYRGVADWRTVLPTAIASAKIHINVSKILFPTGVGPRVFETLACGRLLISNRIPAIAELFEEDREIVFFDDLDDLEDKVRYYLDHADERDAIASRGRAKVLAEHDLEIRARHIAEVAGLPRPG